MKNYTYRGCINSKYPIVSSETGNKYEVEISPYGQDDARYLEGCVITLNKKGRIFSTQLITRHFSNNNGKIKLEYFRNPDWQTEINYNMVDMTKLIVRIYESSIKQNIKDTKQMENDYIEFATWNGEI